MELTDRVINPDYGYKIGTDNITKNTPIYVTLLHNNSKEQVCVETAGTLFRLHDILSLNLDNLEDFALHGDKLLTITIFDHYLVSVVIELNETKTEENRLATWDLRFNHTDSEEDVTWHATLNDFYDMYAHADEFDDALKEQRKLVKTVSEQYASKVFKTTSSLMRLSKGVILDSCNNFFQSETYTELPPIIKRYLTVWESEEN
jgi:hypothetical protein